MLTVRIWRWPTAIPIQWRTKTERKKKVEKTVKPSRKRENAKKGGKLQKNKALELISTVHPILLRLEMVGRSLPRQHGVGPRISRAEHRHRFRRHAFRNASGHRSDTIDFDDDRGFVGSSCLLAHRHGQSNQQKKGKGEGEKLEGFGGNRAISSSLQKRSLLRRRNGRDRWIIPVDASHAWIYFPPFPPFFFFYISLFLTLGSLSSDWGRESGKREEKRKGVIEERERDALKGRSGRIWGRDA